MRALFWIAFILAVVFIGRISLRITCLAGSDNSIIKIELAGKDDGAKIVKAWSDIKYKCGTVLDLARKDTYWDFLFIVIYVGLIMVESTALRQFEPWYPLNELLRMNLFLAVIAGLLDIIENFIILHNLHHFAIPDHYFPSQWFSIFKFVLAGWCVLIWLIALVHQLILRNKKPEKLPVHTADLNPITFVQKTTTTLTAMGDFNIVAYLKDNGNSIEDRVKDAILYTNGDNHPDPSRIDNDRALADLPFDDQKFLRLTQRFNIIILAKKVDGITLDVSDISGLTDVQACIDEVTKSTT